MATPTVLVQFRVDLDSYQRIEGLAGRAGITPTAFCKQAALAAMFSGGGSAVGEPVRRETPAPDPVPDVPKPAKPPKAVIKEVEDVPEAVQTAIESRPAPTREYSGPISKQDQARGNLGRPKTR